MDVFNERGTRSEMQAKVEGQIVVTTYNNRWYRVDGIDFEKDPRSTFPKRLRRKEREELNEEIKQDTKKFSKEGDIIFENMSYIEYYAK